MFNLFKKNKKGKERVITRIAPSPTGMLHIGTARAALFNYLFARQNSGKFILRIEDTDKERNKKEYEENVVESINWLGLQFDGYYKQSERGDIYKKYLNKLIESGNAYISKESAGERSEVIRFKNPNKEIAFNDIIRGEIKFDTTELGDFVIAKSLDEPLYHLAVVVDDHEMAITHIIRGEDGISNTPRQILIQQAIGAKTPKYAHLPLVLGKDKSKLSKRHGAASISEYKDRGYSKEAIINHLAMLGWNPGTEQEVFTIEELIREFDLKKVSKGGAVFEIEKLDWFNKEHLRKQPKDEIIREIKNKIKKQSAIDTSTTPEAMFEKIYKIVIERISKITDIDELIEKRELDYFFDAPDYDPRNLIWKEVGAAKTVEHLQNVSQKIESLPSEEPGADEIKKAIWNYADEQGRGDVLWPLRYCLSGLEKSPDPFSLINILGKTESVRRVQTAIQKLNDL